MKMKSLQVLGYAIFFFGVSVGFVLTAITIWDQVEAMSYFFEGVTYDPFHGLRCPVLMAPTEKGLVTTVFNNPTNEEDTFYYRAEISGSPYRRQIKGQIAVSPRQTKSIPLTVDAKDEDLLFFIFVKMHTLPNAVRPSQEAVCGILMVDMLGLTGMQLSIMGIVLSFLGIAIGLGLFQQASTKMDRNTQRLIPALGLVVLLAMFSGAMGWWIAGVALLVITLLLLVTSLRFAIA